ncbi:hypothetical protein SOASR030_29160 [Leminorella grimontii]|uniref:Uncharacterized protein n=1 Tax=Leminorella grimontii TaxID=82981 RepID=A0AAV5N774_9GAMM|nr:hypothetical protein SOASR030_29160 [Leminorella grimontii]
MAHWRCITFLDNCPILRDSARDVVFIDDNTMVLRLKRAEKREERINQCERRRLFAVYDERALFSKLLRKEI